MRSLGTLLLLLTACLAVSASPVLTLPNDIQVQENFDLSRIYGKWFHVAVGSTCPWLKRFKDKMTMGTLMLGEGATEREISVTKTHRRKGICEVISGAYEKTSTDGKFLYHKSSKLSRRRNPQIFPLLKQASKVSDVLSSCPFCLSSAPTTFPPIFLRCHLAFLQIPPLPFPPLFLLLAPSPSMHVLIQNSRDGAECQRQHQDCISLHEWNITMESYVVHTNYDEYAIFLTKKFSRRHGPTLTAKLYGREPQLRESLLEEFREVALGVGIPEDSIFTMPDRGECVPGEQEPEPTLLSRARRAVLPQEEEGSGAGQPVADFSKKEDSCQLGYSQGPCLGMIKRYFYNGSSMACETFHYGGCMGNGNNFVSEKECLQTCRTVEACSLPIVSGPCRGFFQLWAFDAVQGKCVLFNYGGCQGNGNQFYSEKECKEYCGVPGEEDEELLRSSN